MPGHSLPGIFPAGDQEQARVLEAYQQDRSHKGIIHDFTDCDLAPKPRRQKTNNPAGAGL